MSQMKSPLMNLQQAFAFISERIPAARLIGDGTQSFLRMHSDTRTLAAGDLFVALKGERFDANQFLVQARESGAVAAIAHGGLEEAGLPGIQVPDSLRAMGALAAGWRKQWHGPLIGVTGSNGKTTVTQMIASILRAWKGDAAFATQGNFNNDIGVPLMLTRLTAAHQVAVIELGMNHPGEIAYLANIARPTVALVNNAQREHLEFMHTVEAVARENGSVFAALPRDGVAVFPAADEYTPQWQELAGARQVLTFGEHAGDVQCAKAQWQGASWQVQIHTPQGAFDTELQIAGSHNVTNALAATACALAAGVPLYIISQGLAQFEPVKGRSRALVLPFAGDRSITLVDDSYNANPDSFRAAIDVLATLPQPQLLVMGDMGEVGDQGPQFHAEAGAYARERGISRLFALGASSTHAVEACGPAAQHFEDMASLLAAVQASLPEVGSVLVKGSRFMKMEQVVQALQAQSAQDTTRQASQTNGGRTCC